MKHDSLSASVEASTARIGTPGKDGANVERAQSGVAREYHAFISDVEHLVASVTSMAGDDLTLVKAKLNARIQAARISLGQAGSAMADHARRGARATDDYVYDKPWGAVALGAVAGILVGLLLGRRGT